MFTQSQLEAYVQGLFSAAATPVSGRDYVLKALREGPSRNPDNKFGNSVIAFVSTKMGSLLLESRRGEFPAAVLADRDPTVHAYFMQPPAVEVFVKNEDGRLLTRHLYTPDMLQIGPGLAVKEYRDEGFLVSRSAKNGYQFYRDDTGRWHYRAAEECFAELGLAFEVVSNSSLPATIVTNTRFLEDYLLVTAPPVPDEVAKYIRQIIVDRRAVPFRELLDSNNFTADQIFRLIADERVYVNLEEQNLADPDNLWIYDDASTYQAHRAATVARLEPPLPLPGVDIRVGSKLTFNEKRYEVVLPGERDVVVRDSDGFALVLPRNAAANLLAQEKDLNGGSNAASAVRQMAQYSKEEVDRAVVRVNEIYSGKPESMSAKTFRHYELQVSAAHDSISSLLACVDNFRNRGNRTPRLPAIVEELASQAIKERYNQPEGRTKKGAFARHVELCAIQSEIAKIKIRPMSYPTFCMRCDDQESLRARGGKRVAYQEAAIAQNLDLSFPVHGVRPHDVCYVDHTEMNLATKSPEGMDLPKPTFSVAVDGNTCNTRAMILNYDPPSIKTVLMLLRDYVRRWSRLPRILVCDNAKEFRSHELRRLCQKLRIDLRFRPPGMPRGGAMVERLIGATEEEVLSQMVGNTINMKDPRLVTASVNGFNRAVWTLTAAYYAIENYLFEQRPNRIHPALGVTPNEFEAKRLRETGHRDHTAVLFDENLMLLTAPHSHRVLHKVDRRRGVWVDGQYYRHPAMDGLKKGSKLEVRVEPWLAAVIYVYINGRWHAAIGTSSRRLTQYTRRECEIVARAQKKLAAAAANRDTLSCKNLRYKETLLTPEMFDPRINAAQREMKYLYSRLGMTVAMPRAIDPLLQEAMPTSPLTAPESDQTPSREGGVASSTTAPTNAGAESKYEGVLDGIDGYY